MILKDDPPAELREDGREKAGISWEVEFKVDGEEKKFWIPWADFTPTYRGKEMKDAGKLKRGKVWRVGIMMRRSVLLRSWRWR